MTKKEKINQPCIHCELNNTIKYGRQKNGEQRYRCMFCKKCFVNKEKRTGYSRKQKKFLSMLLNFLEGGDYGKYTLQEAVDKIDADVPEISKFKLVQTEPEAKEISCYNPRLLICKEGAEIKIYMLQRRIKRVTEQNIRHCVVTINDIEITE